MERRQLRVHLGAVDGGPGGLAHAGVRRHGGDTGRLFMCNTEESVWWWGGRTLDRRGGMTKAAMERGKGES